jgi:hypothetical protein
MAYVGFDKLKGQLASRPGVSNPGALAAAIGRKKYGKAAMAKASRSGHNLKGHKVKHSAARDRKIAQFVKGR